MDLLGGFKVFQPDPSRSSHVFFFSWLWPDRLLRREHDDASRVFRKTKAKRVGKPPDFSHHPTFKDIISNKHLKLMFRIKEKYGTFAKPCAMCYKIYKYVTHHHDTSLTIFAMLISWFFAPSCCWCKRQELHLPSENMGFKPTSMVCVCICMYWCVYIYKYI